MSVQRKTRRSAKVKRFQTLKDGKEFEFEFEFYWLVTLLVVLQGDDAVSLQ